MTADEARMQHFRSLPHDEQQSAIRRLIARGFGDHSIAQATCLSVEQIAAIRAGTVHSLDGCHYAAAVPCPRFDPEEFSDVDHRSG